MSDRGRYSSTAAAQVKQTVPATSTESALRTAKVIAGNRFVHIVLGIVLLVALSQVSVPLGFTPVPIALGSLAALLVGVFFGPVKGALSAVSFAGLAAGGAPILAGAASGWKLTTFGYVLGYVLAAFIAGMTMRWVQSRRTIGARQTHELALIGAGLLIASLAIHVPGVLWLASFANISLTSAIELGSLPFWFGDLLKVIFVLGLLSVTKARSIRS